MIASTLRATAAWLAAIVLSMTLAAGSAALAAAHKGQQPGGHLKISEVFVDFTNVTIKISGEDFDFGPGPLTVTLGDPDLIAAGSIVCTPDFIASPQTIVCAFSVPGLPAAGDYLLTVATGTGQSQSDEYDLTIADFGNGGPADRIKVVKITGIGPQQEGGGRVNCPNSHPNIVTGGYSIGSFSGTHPERFLYVVNFAPMLGGGPNDYYAFHALNYDTLQTISFVAAIICETN